ncbi:MAG: N4-gp56 family major capsid protein [Planctomycetota bacterium]|jgi:N4-gp56 family major capsid protein
MAATTFARGSTHTALVPQKWSKDDFKFAFENNPLTGYIGPGKDKIIQVGKDFLKEQGDKITFGLKALPTGDGQGDDGTYASNGEAMTFYDMSVQLHERGHSFPLNGNMTEQSAYRKLRPQGQDTARQWVGMVQAADIIAALSGMGCMNHIGGRVTGVTAKDASSVQLETVNQSAVSKGASATRWFGGGQTTGGTISRVATDALINTTASHLFGTDVIEYVRRMARMTVDSSGNAVSPIRPIMVNGEPWYLMLIDLLQKKQLQADTKWKASVQNALPRSAKQNWLFNGADGVWDNVVIKSTDLLHRRTGAGSTTVSEWFDTSADACASGMTVGRSLFLGAQAACLAWGKMPVWKSGYNDPPHNTKYEVHTDMIYGVKKSVFNSIDFGCICVDTALVTD